MPDAMSLADVQHECVIRNLSVVAYVQGTTIWHYRGHEVTLADRLLQPVGIQHVQQPGFFDPSSDLMSRGDWIVVSAVDGGVQLYVDATDPHVVTRPLCATVG